MKLKRATDSKETVKYTDLRQVMDYKRPLSIFFSGVEQESYLDILYDLGIRNFLMSYEYLKGKGNSQLKKYNDMHLFIDSGAFTYQNDPQYEEYTNEQWEKQIVEYLSWAKRHKDQIFAIADLDLQYLSNVGYDKVNEWRKKYFEPFMLETGIPVCFIWHTCDGLDVWEYMCKRYPYVGLSLAIDKAENGSNMLHDMFKIAEKHNTLCQGMASTNTKLLVQYPFYTVDSTTWLAGLKYGEISVWKSTKMSRIKKQDFESKAFPYISMYDMEFDFDLIRQEDTTEMIRVNAYAFVQAEKYVRDRLRARMYWLKAKTKRIDIDHLPEDFFPDVEWLSTDIVPNDAPIYAEKMNINPNLGETTFLCIKEMTTFFNWDNESYKELKEEYLENEGAMVEELHDTYINRIVQTFDEKVEDLIEFYKECLSGNRDTLLQLGTNFDRIVKEREDNEYITDEEYEYEDIPDIELNNTLAQFLPEKSEAPEIDDLDDEIFREQGIEPVRDKNGHFLKGQRKVLKPKKLYSEKYPKLACDMCVNAQNCPEYKSGYVCAYNKMFQRYNTRDMADVIQAMQGIVDFSMQRLQRGMMTEMLNGGIPDPAVSQMMNQSMGLLGQLQRMYECGSQAVIKQTKVVRADGTQETTTQVSNPQSGGILAQIFGNMSSNEEPKEEVIDITPKEETENKD